MADIPLPLPLPQLPMLPLLRLRGIRKAFGVAQALRGVDLDISQGEVHALIGENGAGKSTLVAILGGALAPDAGSMEFLGVGYHPRSPREAGNLGVSLVHQELALADHLTVAENITLGREISRFGFVLDPSEKVRETLEWLGFGEIDPQERVGNLGVAERQIVEIARALFLDSRLILMDEPTSSLTARDSEKLFTVIGKLKAKRVSVVYISHFLDEVAKIADRITILRDGETVSAGLPGSTPVDEIIQAMVGRPVNEIYPASTRKSGSVVLDLEAWQVHAGAPSVTLSIHGGQILGIAGLVGSGRSTFLRSLVGLHAATSGTLTLANNGRFRAGTLNPKRAMALGLGFLSENRKEEGLAMDLSIRANVTLADLHTQTNRMGLIRFGAEGKRVAQLCQQMKVKFYEVDQPVGTLSGGNQQKVALSRLLLGETEVWLLDEPTRGVDVASKAEIYSLISAWAERGKAVIWVGSYLPELFGVCDSLAVMHRGELSGIQPVNDWTEASVMAYATQGVQP